MSKVDLVVLAAGMASRYGGIKQLESVGASGQTLLQYSVHDALASSCSKVIFIIRKAIEKDFREKVFDQIASYCDAEYVFQETDTLVPQKLKSYSSQRQKPYGTVQAILSARDVIDDNFIVINADDFYGRGSYELLCEHFRTSSENALVGYTLGQTLSDIGTVNRGICRFTAEGELIKIEETYKISSQNGEIIGFDKSGDKVILNYDDMASMNFFGLNKDILAMLEDYWADFLTTISTDNSSECLLPVFCNEKLQQGVLKFKCYRARDKWMGMTYKEDREIVRKQIAKYTEDGIYPEIFSKKA